jgi:hypothetical protein
MENVGIFYVHLVYFTAIGNILWPFGMFCDHLVYFPLFWYVVPRKIWQPWLAVFGTKLFLNNLLFSIQTFVFEKKNYKSKLCLCFQRKV